MTVDSLRFDPRRRAALGLTLAAAAALAAWRPARAQESQNAEARPFSDWLEEFRAEARREGVSGHTLDFSLAGLQPIARVLELDRKQPERTLTFSEYMDRVVTPTRVDTGRNRIAEHERVLRAVGDKYGVQPRFIVALWGIESDFGRITGGFPVVAALATLAYDGRRAAFFRRELIEALRILDEERIPIERFSGSWAGAMGQSQFMPSSFRSYAVDYDGDGKRDIWSSLPDVFASAANYLARAGWRADQTWGREIRLPSGFDRGLIGLEREKPLAEWRRLGVTRPDGAELPAREISGSLLQPGGEQGPTMLVYNNFRTILKWNRSNYFATAVGTLADRIEAP